VVLAEVLGAVALCALAWRLQRTDVGLVILVVATVVAVRGMDGARWKQWAKYHRTADFFLSAACIAFTAGAWAADLTGRPVMRIPSLVALICAITCSVAWRRWAGRSTASVQRTRSGP
jgi:hypothetical protein